MADSQREDLGPDLKMAVVAKQQDRAQVVTVNVNKASTVERANKDEGSLPGYYGDYTCLNLPDQEGKNRGSIWLHKGYLDALKQKPNDRSAITTPSEFDRQSQQLRVDLEALLKEDNHEIQKLRAENEFLRVQYQNAIDARKALAQAQKAQTALMTAQVEPATPAAFVRTDHYFNTLYKDLQSRVKDFVEDHFSLDGSPSSSHKIIEKDIKSNSRFRAMRQDRQTFTSSPSLFLALKESCVWDFLYTEIFGGQYSGSKHRWAGDDASHLCKICERVFSVQDEDTDSQVNRDLHAWRSSTVNLLTSNDQQQDGMTNGVEDLGRQMHEYFKLSEQDKPTQAFRNQAKRILKLALQLDLEIQKQRSHVFFRFPRLRKQNGGIWRARDLMAKSAQMHHWDESIDREPQGQVRLIVSPALVRSGTSDGTDYGTEIIVTKALIILEEQETFLRPATAEDDKHRASTMTERTSTTSHWHTPPQSPATTIAPGERLSMDLDHMTQDLPEVPKLDQDTARASYDASQADEKAITVIPQSNSTEQRAPAQKPQPSSNRHIADVTHVAEPTVPPVRVPSATYSAFPHPTSTDADPKSLVGEGSQRSLGGTPLSVKDRLFSRRDAARQNISKAMQSKTKGQPTSELSPPPQAPTSTKRTSDTKASEANRLSMAVKFFAIPEDSLRIDPKQLLTTTDPKSSNISIHDYAPHRSTTTPTPEPPQSRSISAASTRSSTRPSSRSAHHQRAMSETSASCRAHSIPEHSTPSPEPGQGNTHPPPHANPRFKIAKMVRERDLTELKGRLGMKGGCFAGEGGSSSSDSDEGRDGEAAEGRGEGRGSAGGDEDRDVDVEEKRERASVVSEGETRFRKVDRLMRRQLVDSLGGRGNWRERERKPGQGQRK